jgi:hypothetical protein
MKQSVRAGSEPVHRRLDNRAAQTAAQCKLSQLLTGDQEADLAAYALQQSDDSGITVKVKDRDDKLAALCGKYATKDARKDVTAAKREFDDLKADDPYHGRPGRVGANGRRHRCGRTGRYIIDRRETLHGSQETTACDIFLRCMQMHIACMTPEGNRDLDPGLTEPQRLGRCAGSWRADGRALAGSRKTRTSRPGPPQA